MCARSCAALRNFLRTRLEALISRMLCSETGRIARLIAQLLAHQGGWPSLREPRVTSATNCAAGWSKLR